MNVSCYKYDFIVLLEFGLHLSFLRLREARSARPGKCFRDEQKKRQRQLYKTLSQTIREIRAPLHLTVLSQRKQKQRQSGMKV